MSGDDFALYLKIDRFHDVSAVAADSLVASLPSPMLAWSLMVGCCAVEQITGSAHVGRLETKVVLPVMYRLRMRLMIEALATPVARLWRLQ